MATWVGSKRLAVVPTITTGAGGGTAIAAQAFQDRVRGRIFFDPDASGVDRSLRRYIHTVSYGRAVLDAEVMPTVTVNWARHATTPPQADPGTTMNAAVMAAGGLANFELVMVVFPAGIAGVRSWAFPGGSAQSKSYVLLDNGIGAWAMELLHMATDFGDLYDPPAGRSPSPGQYDEMDSADATHPSSFTKQAMGWLDASAIVTAIPTPAAQHFVLHPLALLQPAPPSRTTALRIPFKQDSASRYFLVEAREALDDYERATSGITSGIPSEGVVVYDVNKGLAKPLWLRTSPALVVGDSFLDSAEGVALTVESRLTGGGFRVRLQPEHVRCRQIRTQLAALAEQIKDLQTELGIAAPPEKPPLAGQIKALQKKVAQLNKEAGGLGCRL